MFMHTEKIFLQGNVNEKTFVKLENSPLPPPPKKKTFRNVRPLGTGDGK